MDDLQLIDIQLLITKRSFYSMRLTMFVERVISRIRRASKYPIL